MQTHQWLWCTSHVGYTGWNHTEGFGDTQRRVEVCLWNLAELSTAVAVLLAPWATVASAVGRPAPPATQTVWGLGCQLKKSPWLRQSLLDSLTSYHPDTISVQRLPLLCIVSMTTLYIVSTTTPKTISSSFPLFPEITSGSVFPPP